MAFIENFTSFGIGNLHSITREGEDILIVCVMGRFDLPPPGQPCLETLHRSEVQAPPMFEDTYWGEPGFSSLRYEGQGAYYRPGTDIYLNGYARAPGRKPVKEMLVYLSIGPCRKEILVLGDRRWRWRFTGLRPSLPKPFVSMPLRYERSFGGSKWVKGALKAYEPRNPVGKGFYISLQDALDQPLPNIENPKDRIRSWRQRPTPMGFGPICRGWKPRLNYSGTYDEEWMQERAPLWPTNLDLRFFSASADGLFASPHLKGGESVIMKGVSEKGEISFSLPIHRLLLECEFKDHAERHRFILDAVLLEPDENRVSLFWRVGVIAYQKLHLIEYAMVRELENWEKDD